jgi:RNA polymerase sigma-70 factor (ECF subfamily)
MANSDIYAMAGQAHNEELDAKSLIGTAQVDRDVILESIVREYSADVALLANRLLGWPGDVDDIVQDVFLSAFTGLKKFRHDCDIKTWLFTITINKCRTYKYKKMLSLKVFEKFSGNVESASSDAAKKQIDNETFGRVRKAVSALPVKYRQAVVLKYLQEMKTADITKILKISENTLNVRLSRARDLLGKKLADLTRE